MGISHSEAYAAAGVDIEAGYQGVKMMNRYVQRTLTADVISDLGGFGGLFSLDLHGLEKPVLVSGTDGVGTKQRIAQLMDRHNTVGIDCVAMCVNDVICAGAKPLVFLDYIACGRNVPEKIANIVKGVAEGCVQADCALVGGETAEHPGMMPEDEYDLAGFSVGVVDRAKILDREHVQAGDVLIALPSSGLHSNGFSLVRRVFDVEKRESIKTLILTLWKREDEAPKRSEEVALSGAVNAYIRKITGNREARPDFNGFYEFVDGDYRRMIAEKKVREKDFDIDGFLNVLEPFYKGGDYDFLLNSDRELDLTNRRFIVFELDNISGNKVLLPVVTLIIMETFIAKMRRLKGIRKVILIEECWKALMSANMSGYIQYLFKTVRKYFGEAVVVTQEVDDIISSPIVKEAIINNSDCKILLDQRKYMNKFEHIQRLLGLTEKEKSQILSINQANHPGRFYREVWIGLGGTRSAVYATEVSAEEYFTFTTEESEKLEVQRLAEELDGNLELAIRRMAERKREEQRQVSTPKREQ